jgi:hypothetical protein
MDQSVMVFDDDTARGSAIPSPIEGMTTYLKDVNVVEAFTGSAFTAVSNVLQIVRATDTTNRATTSTSFVDASLSVTITPKLATSNIILMWTFRAESTNSAPAVTYQLTDNSNNALSGAEAAFMNASYTGTARWPLVLVAFDSPATTSATTYKARFSAGATRTNTLENSAQTGQLLAIEVAG